MLILARPGGVAIIESGDFASVELPGDNVECVAASTSMKTFEVWESGVHVMSFGRVEAESPPLGPF